MPVLHKGQGDLNITRARRPIRRGWYGQPRHRPPLWPLDGLGMSLGQTVEIRLVTALEREQGWPQVR